MPVVAHGDGDRWQAAGSSSQQTYSVFFWNFLTAGNEALCKKLGRQAILMVASTEAVGGILRCATLAVKDDLALEKWIHCLHKVSYRCRNDAREFKEWGECALQANSSSFSIVSRPRLLMQESLFRQ